MIDKKQKIDCGTYYKISILNKKRIKIGVLKIDKIDYDKIKNYGWNINGWGYVQATINKKSIKIHKILMPIKDKIVDHINRNRLDNCRSNLRYTSRSINSLNKNTTKRNKANCNGVNYYNIQAKWRCDITINGKRIFLGYFSNKLLAISVRKEAESKYLS